MCITLQNFKGIKGMKKISTIWEFSKFLHHRNKHWMIILVLILASAEKFISLSKKK